MFIRKIINSKKFMLKISTILITGGTGSFGKAFLYKILRQYHNIKKIIIFSRDELKQHELLLSLKESQRKKVRFFLGDIRDKNRLLSAFADVDCVIHAAALKQVPAAEYNPLEFVKTNIIGAQNIVEAAIEKNVKKVVALSTDKACSPINLYGATKLCSDKIFSAANNIVGKKNITFSVVRYGNVFASRGSVIPLFNHYAKNFGYLPITDKSMTRFNLSLEEAVDLVFLAIKKSVGGEIFVPKIPSYRIMDLANAFNSKIEKKIIGIRPGEKLHEELISISDSLTTFDMGKYYLILPSAYNDGIYKKKYKFLKPGNKVKSNFFYNSLNNQKFLSISQLKSLIQNYIKNNA